MALGDAHTCDRQREEQTYAEAIVLKGGYYRIGKKQVRRAHDDKRGIAVGAQVGGFALIDQRSRSRSRTERVAVGSKSSRYSDAGLIPISNRCSRARVQAT